MTETAKLRRFALSNGTIFFLFAAGIALRDIISEYLFPTDSICLAFLVCAVIAVISGVMLIFGRPPTKLRSRLRDRNVLGAILVLATMAAAIYAVTFYMLSLQTAGPFDLLDYGIAPLLTAAIGFVRLHEPIRRRFYISIVLFVGGMIMVAIGREHASTELSIMWIGIALISPIATAISDASSQWLLKSRQLRREEVLFCRFAPAAVLLFIYIITVHPGGLHLNKGVAGLVLAVVLGFGPLYLLCTGLGRAALTEYASYEGLIPAFVFFGTLAWHPANRTPMAISGASLVLFGVLVAEGSIASYLSRRLVGTTEPANG